MPVDYLALMHFLLDPLVDDPQALKIDQELLRGGSRILIRVALEGHDRGRILGRGGRNVNAVRQVVQAAGHLGAQDIHLEFFGVQGTDDADHSHPGGHRRSGDAPRTPPPKPIRRSRSPQSDR